MTLHKPLNPLSSETSNPFYTFIVGLYPVIIGIIDEVPDGVRHSNPPVYANNTVTFTDCTLSIRTTTIDSRATFPDLLLSPSFLLLPLGVCIYNP